MTTHTRSRVPVRVAGETTFHVRADEPRPGTCGSVEGVALVYGVVDSYGTRFKRGCLDRTKREKLAAGKVALYLDHDYGTRTHVGVVRAMTTDGEREIMRADLFDTEDGRRAKEYLGAVMAAEARTGFSIGFYDRESGMVTTDGDSVLEFVEVELEEVSITPRPAVPGAQVTGVRREPDTALYATALRGIRAAVGAEQFRALVEDCEREPASHTDAAQDSDDATPDSRDAEAPETPAPTYATMDERLAAVRASFRSI